MNQKVILLIIAIIIIFSVQACWNAPKLFTTPLTEGKTIEIPDGDVVWQLRTLNPMKVKLSVLDPAMDLAYKSFISGGFIAMRKRDYDEYKRLQALGTCPAGYVNQHNMLYLVLTPEKEIIDQIRHLKRDDVVTAKGYWLEMTKAYRDNAPKVVFSVDPPKKSEYIYVNEIQVTHANN
jgi:hypothetical protein